MSFLNNANKNENVRLNIKTVFLSSNYSLSDQDKKDLVGKFYKLNNRYRLNDKRVKVLLLEPFNRGVIDENTNVINLVSDDSDEEEDNSDDDIDIDISQEFIQKSILGSPSLKSISVDLHPEIATSALSTHSLQIRTSDLTHLQLFNGDWVIAHLSHSPHSPRLIQVFLSEQYLPKSTTLISSQLFFNLNNGRNTSDAKITLNSLSSSPIIPIASSATIARISSPITIDKTYQERFHKALQDYFNYSARLYRRGDVFSVDIPVESVDKPRFEQDEQQNLQNHPLLRSKRTAKVWFKVTQLSVTATQKSPIGNGDLGAWILPGDTGMLTLGVQQSYVPRDINQLSSKAFKTMRELFESALKSHDMGLDVQLTLMTIGQRGSSKSKTIESTAHALGLHYLKVNCYDVADDNESQVEGSLQARFEKGAGCTPIVLHFEDVDALFSKNEERKGSRVATVFKECLKYLKEMSNKTGLPAIVTASTTDSDILPSAFSGCFKHEIRFEAPDRADREAYLEHLLTDMQVASDVSTKELAEHTASLFPADIDNVVSRAHINALKRALDMSRDYVLEDILSAGITISSRDVEDALKESRANHSTNIGAPSIPNVKWDDIGGLKDVKADILDTVQLPLERPELFAGGLKKRSVKGVLLFGPPGTGKTLLAKAVATECSLNFFSVKGPELLNMYIGESEANVRRIFQKARDARPCVIFFDELDSVAPKRGNQGDSGGVMDRIVSQLLAELDGMSAGNSDVFVIGATNRPDLLDSALLRPGRFDRMIYLDVPLSHSSQAAILEALTRKFKLEPGLDLLNDVAAHLPLNLTGADLYALCSDAMLKSMTRKVMSIERKITSINELDDKEFIKQYGSQLRRPLIPQYYLEFMASSDEIDVVVSKDDFDEAMNDLSPSVSQAEMEHYRQAQRKFTNVSESKESKESEIQKELKKDKGKGKGKARE
ncbi:AAA-domain-containing protein [Wallemia mellicola]|nr:AAA-domain-containing protein [Wallemia mellicola]